MASLNIKTTALILAGMIAGGVISVGIYTYYSSAKATAETGQAAPKEDRKVLFWYDPMYPNTRFDKPGKSPFMDMDLIPKYADEETASASAPGVRIDPTQTQNLGLKQNLCAVGRCTTRKLSRLTLAITNTSSLLSVHARRLYRKGLPANRGRQN